MLVIGLVGGIASGKSFVAKCFADLGAHILDADKIGHEVLGLPAVIAEVRNHWPSVVQLDDTIDRKLLAQIVFRSATHEQQLDLLEKITHPRIGQRIDQRLAELKAAEVKAVVLDAPVLFKAGWHYRCDKIVFVDATESVRQQRAKARGWALDELKKREQSQTPLLTKQKLASEVVDNSQSKEITQAQIIKLWTQWGLA